MQDVLTVPSLDPMVLLHAHRQLSARKSQPFSLPSPEEHVTPSLLVRTTSTSLAGTAQHSMDNTSLDHL